MLKIDTESGPRVEEVLNDDVLLHLFVRTDGTVSEPPDSVTEEGLKNMDSGEDAVSANIDQLESLTLKRSVSVQNQFSDRNKESCRDPSSLEIDTKRQRLDSVDRKSPV